VNAKVRALIGVAISAAVMWWLIAKSGIDWAAAWLYVKTANVPLLILALLVANCMFPLRARRWRPILHDVKPDMPFAPLWHATAIGMMANTLLPLRMGEVARAYALSREDRDIPVSASLASLLVDRIFDAAVIILLLVVALFLPDVPADAEVGGRPLTSLAIIPAIAAVVGMIVLFVFAVYPAPALRTARAIGGVFGQRWADALENLARRFTDGLGALRTPRRFFEVFFWATLHWLAQPLAFWIGFKAFGIDAPFAAALVAQFTITVAVALPSAPGFIGLYEIGAASGLLLFGVERSPAIAWAVTLHVVTLVPITPIGLFYLNRIGLHMGDLRRESETAHA
jgi:uncharacterized protein (TIRG00374 family)